MLLAVQPATIGIISTIFGFQVPGHQIWKPRSFRATATRGAGGAPDRSYLLTITDGTNVVAAIGADDAGTEPGSIDVTWALMPAAVSSAGAFAVSVAPLAPFSLRPGYQITGTILGAVSGDAWTDVVAWYDYSYTIPPGVF